jgi:hypothetical protein
VRVIQVFANLDRMVLPDGDDDEEVDALPALTGPGR